MSRTVRQANVRVMRPFPISEYNMALVKWRGGNLKSRPFHFRAEMTAEAKHGRLYNTQKQCSQICVCEWVKGRSEDKGGISPQIIRETSQQKTLHIVGNNLRLRWHRRNKKQTHTVSITKKTWPVSLTFSLLLQHQVIIDQYAYDTVDACLKTIYWKSSTPSLWAKLGSPWAKKKMNKHLLCLETLQFLSDEIAEDTSLALVFPNSYST